MKVDKQAIQQVLGNLANNPSLLAQTDKYQLSVNDFETRFEKNLFNAICGLFSQGLKKISVIDIENYLSTNQSAKLLFDKQNGRDYVQDILDFVENDSSGFDYYYTKLKKFNLLRDLQKQGFDISDYYSDDPFSLDGLKIAQHFEETTLTDICNSVKQKLLKIETEYAKNQEIEVVSITDGLTDLLQDLDKGCEVGVSLQGDIYNKVLSGAQKGCLTIRSSPSGCGKTTTAFADACYLAFPIRYDIDHQQWEQKGSVQKVLFVITEQSIEQAQKKVLAYLSGVSESVFKYGNFDEETKNRLKKALWLMEQYQDNFTIIRIPDPNIQILQNVLREQAILKQVDFIFYDYIFISPNLLNEFRGHNLRNDELLLLMATALKDLAVELNVGVFTSTQVNASADNNREIRNEASLAGGRATINKADNGIIMARPTNDELEMIKPLMQAKVFPYEPNRVFDIFKVRSGQWSQVRIWSYVDLGTLRINDMFITDSRLNPVEGFEDVDMPAVIDYTDEEAVKILKVRDQLNGN